VNRAALYYRDILPRGNETGGMKLTIGMLGVSSFEYIITFLALQRLGLSSLLLSTRLADNAFEHLLETCECDQVIVQPAFKPAMSRVKVKRPSLQMSDFIPSSRLAILNGVKMEEVRTPCDGCRRPLCIYD
jgi:acyl-coenzyme A synthetase/AMP-(fatty) acid ligase